MGVIMLISSMKKWRLSLIYFSLANINWTLLHSRHHAEFWGLRDEWDMVPPYGIQKTMGKPVSEDVILIQYAKYSDTEEHLPWVRGGQSRFASQTLMCKWKFLGFLFKGTFWFWGLWWDLRYLVSNRLLSAAAAGPRISLWVGISWTM